jgi:6-phosphogluconolactonase
VSSPNVLKLQRPQLLVAETPQQLAAAAARQVLLLLRAARAARASGPVRIALSGGTTPYAALAILARESFPWDETEWYWVDERFVPQGHERSNVGAATRAFFTPLRAAGYSPVLCAPQLPGALPDRESPVTLAAATDSAAQYAALLAQATRERPLDIVVLGMGDDGHTASLFPHDPELLVRDRAALAVPARAGRDVRISMTAPVIERSGAIIVLVQGASKVAAMTQLLGAPSTSSDATSAAQVAECPARLIWNCVTPALLLADAAAAGWHVPGNLSK